MILMPKTLYHITSKGNAWEIWNSQGINPKLAAGLFKISFYCRWSKIGIFIGHTMMRHHWPFEDIAVLVVPVGLQAADFLPRNAVFLCNSVKYPKRQYNASRFRRFVAPDILEACAKYAREGENAT